MRDNISDLANWPKRRNGQPFLNSTNESYLYAQLIYDNPPKKADLIIYRQEVYKQLKAERERKKPNLQTMMDKAVRAQFFRECLEECQRITDENFNH